MTDDEAKVIEVCVAASGAATAVGENAPASAAAVRAGVAGFADHPLMVDLNGDPFIVSPAPYLPDTMPIAERLTELAGLAASEAAAELTRSHVEQPKLQLFLGLPEPRPGLPSGFARQVVEGLKAEVEAICEVQAIHQFPHGHAGGVMAMEAANDKIRNGEAEFCLAGGVDSYYDEETLGWIEDSRQLHNGSNPHGFIPGEAAGFCLLCPRDLAREAKLSASTRVMAAATCDEEAGIKSNKVCTGRGLTQAFRKVLGAMPTSGRRITQVITDQNGEAYRADEYGFTLSRTERHFFDGSLFEAPADCWGDVGAASGPLFVMLAAHAAEKGYIRGPFTLISTSSEAGKRSALLLRLRSKKRKAA